MLIRCNNKRESKADSLERDKGDRESINCDVESEVSSEVKSHRVDCDVVRVIT